MTVGHVVALYPERDKNQRGRVAVNGAGQAMPYLLYILSSDFFLYIYYRRTVKNIQSGHLNMVVADGQHCKL